ncbi:hypothetical protein ABT340_04700 [Streptosporangium sp. NPDC000239]|uniref:hypothetical protein n=1 Tax=Streptosporangium sp. NPDC000239 TaxID=3154248 RepID=UPI0033248753
MRLTDPVAAFVVNAITDQADPGEVVDYEVQFELAPRPGGYNPSLVVILVGRNSSEAPVMAPPATINSAITTQAAIDTIVANALTWIRAQ